MKTRNLIPDVDPLVEPHARHAYELADQYARDELSTGHLDQFVIAPLRSERAIADLAPVYGAEIAQALEAERNELFGQVSELAAEISSTTSQLNDLKKKVHSAEARRQASEAKLKTGQRRWLSPGVRIASRLLVLVLGVGDTILLYNTLDRFGDDDRLRYVIVVSVALLTAGAAHIAGMSRAKVDHDDVPMAERESAARLSWLLGAAVVLSILAIAGLRAVDAPQYPVAAGAIFGALQSILALISFWLGRQFGPEVEEAFGARSEERELLAGYDRCQRQIDGAKADMDELEPRLVHLDRRRDGLREELRDLLKAAMSHHRHLLVTHWPDPNVALHLEQLTFPKVPEPGRLADPIDVSPVGQGTAAHVPQLPAGGARSSQAIAPAASPAPASSGALILNLVNPSGPAATPSNP